MRLLLFADTLTSLNEANYGQFCNNLHPCVQGLSPLQPQPDVVSVQPVPAWQASHGKQNQRQSQSFGPGSNSFWLEPGIL